MLPPGQAVLINGAHIEAVGPATEFQGSDALTIDLEGGTLLPGLIDCHAHLVLSGGADVWNPLLSDGPATLALRALANAQACLEAGVTSLRDCGGVDHVEFAVRDACAAGTFMGPTIVAAGRFICMTGGANAPVARIADGAVEVRKAVREQIAAGCDFVKLMATGAVLTPGSDVNETHYTDEELRAGVEEARRRGRRTAAHAIGSEGVLAATRAGATSIEHGMILTDECIGQMLAAGTFLVPTLAAVASIVENAGASLDPGVVEKARAVSVRHALSVKAFYDAGGRIAMGADTGTPFNPHGRNPRELGYMVAAGMRPLDALRSATSIAAELLELPLRGRIAPGFAADLLIVAGTLDGGIDDVTDVARHRHVYKNGIRVHTAPLLTNPRTTID